MNIERVKAELVCGNLYINRGITGAIVERQPFGGFRMSGGGTKAGGREYLLNFLVPRVVTENCLRRGFAPAGAGVARRSKPEASRSTADSGAVAAHGDRSWCELRCPASRLRDACPSAGTSYRHASHRAASINALIFSVLTPGGMPPAQERISFDLSASRPEASAPPRGPRPASLWPARRAGGCCRGW